MLLYGLEAVPVISSELKRLNLAYNRAFMKVFSSYNLPVIKQCQYYSGYLPFSNIYDIRKINFLHAMLHNEHYMFGIFRERIYSDLCSILNMYNCNVADSISTVKRKVWISFENDALS